MLVSAAIYLSIKPNYTGKLKGVKALQGDLDRIGGGQRLDKLGPIHT